MERIASRIAEKISQNIEIDAEKKAVITYGLVAIIQFVAIFLISSILALFLNVWLETVIIFFCVVLLRKATGGAHSKTIYGCLGISVFVIIAFALISKYVVALNNSISNLFFHGSIFLIFIVIGVIAFKKVPVDTPNKPITNPKKIKKLRITSFVTLFLYFLVAMTLPAMLGKTNASYSYAICIALATIWQAFTLTATGHKLIDAIDKKFS